MREHFLHSRDLHQLFYKPVYDKMRLDDKFTTNYFAREYSHIKNR